MKKDLKLKLSNLPKKPGCYLMKDINGTVIYVGKAKNLFNRVKSYFTGSHDGKTARLVSEIIDFEYIVTNTETESLILELNLIKKHDPHYNILLKDDKTYPYIELYLGKHPKLSIVRKIDKKKKDRKYFGPYPNVKSANETKKLLDKIYPLRKCNKIPDDVCLYYHMHQCLAPCVNEINENDYKKILENITKFLNGNIDNIREELVEKMNTFAENLEYERAKEVRDLLNDIKSTVQKQKVTMNDLVDRDVFGYYFDKGYLSINVFFYRQGKLVANNNYTYPIVEVAENEFLSFIGQYYNKKPYPKEIFVQDDNLLEQLKSILECKLFVPKRGQKRELVELAIENARIQLDEKFYLVQRDEDRTIKAVEELGNLLNIKYPKRIEAFDNSHTNGVNPVSAMVVFLDGKEHRKDYRKYKLDEENRSDDIKNMKEVIYRRYFKVLRDDLIKPDLIVIDGGITQVNACKMMLNDLGLNLPVCGFVKDDKHRTSKLLDGRTMEFINVDRKSNAFYLMMKIQEEVHRFAISFQRQIRSKTSYKSLLDEIDGIGSVRKRLILKHFKTLDRIKSASLEEYKKIGIPENIAKEILKKFN